MGLGLLELSSCIGSWAWMEIRSFEVVGGWVQSEQLGAAKLQFHSHSMRMGAHAMAFQRLLPEIAGSDPSGFVAPPTPGAVQFMDEAGGLTLTAERLGVAYALMAPRKTVAYRNYLSGAVPVSEMPTIRAVAAVLADEERDLSVGISIWEAIRKQGQAASEAVAAISRFESIIRDSDPFEFSGSLSKST